MFFVIRTQKQKNLTSRVIGVVKDRESRSNADLSYAPLA